MDSSVKRVGVSSFTLYVGVRKTATSDFAEFLASDGHVGRLWRDFATLRIVNNTPGEVLQIHTRSTSSILKMLPRLSFQTFVCEAAFDKASQEVIVACLRDKGLQDLQLQCHFMGMSGLSCCSELTRPLPL